MSGCSVLGPNTTTEDKLRMDKQKVPLQLSTKQQHNLGDTATQYCGSTDTHRTVRPRPTQLQPSAVGRVAPRSIPLF
eukprot:scaffold1134_cov57-Phaeocystis_antarctica.AAC.7